ncbi:MAG: hypothetical protein LJE94_00315 [Deltaproteobacteria bacterium]|nr:hypothetical protein [Deltaproteobacteria bacterium]
MNGDKHPWAGVARLIIIILFLSAGVTAANAGPFEKGSRRFSIVAGSGRMLDSNYAIFGVGAGVFAADGLELGLDGEAWLGSDPGIYKLSPRATYILPVRSRVRPYGGVFYSHIFIEDYDDLDTAGVRGGVYITTDKSWFLGLGAVYEVYLNCDESIHASCDDTYPEVSILITF